MSLRVKEAHVNHVLELLTGKFTSDRIGYVILETSIKRLLKENPWIGRDNTLLCIFS